MLTKIENNEKISVLDSVVRRLEEYLLSIDLEINDKLPAELKLSENLGIARPTLREAYRILEAKGYVKRIPGRGVFLVEKEKPSLDPISTLWFKEHKFELEEVFRVRLVLESLMIECVLEKDSLDSLYHELKCNLIEFAAADYSPNKANVYTRLDENFHQIICSHSGNEFLIKIFNSVLTPVMHEPRFVSFKLELNWKSACRAHERIVNSIEKKNPIAIKEALEDHIRQTRALFYLND